MVIKKGRQKKYGDKKESQKSMVIKKGRQKKVRR